MLLRVRAPAVLVFSAVMPFLGAASATAQVAGSCTITVNGVAIDRIDSLDSPLELETTDTLVFSGTSDAGTLTARVRLLIGPVVVESNSTTYATPAQEFEASISLDDVSPYGVGLFRVAGEADGCIGEAWVRVSGRFPLATLTGITALGLALGGITGQLGAIVSRNRWARSAAALGGIATGSGAAVCAQQFGRLQVSYPSLAATSAAAAILGFAAAWALNPTLRDARLERRRAELLAPHPTPEPATARSRPASSPEPAVRSVTADDAAKSTEPAGQPASGESGRAAEADVPRDTAPYWFYVMAPTDVFDLNDHTRTVATLQPGTWYLAKRTVEGWAHVVATGGEEGWVAESAIHRQG